MVTTRNRALAFYGLAALIIGAGVAVAAMRVPGGFDWAYTVISKLASSRHNPDGGMWLSGSLLAAVVVLWPVVSYLEDDARSTDLRPALSILALRAGLIGGGLLGVEGLLGLDLSRLGRKAHETLALLAFIGLYGGILGLYARRVRRSAAALWPALLVLLPLCAVGLSQVMLYFDQRELGWVSTEWREMGVPIWLSFAFWQWLSVSFIGVGLGYLVAAPETGARGPGRERVGADGGRE
jgi:hypothetical protein